jgi:hypothetical protein
MSISSFESSDALLNFLASSSAIQFQNLLPQFSFFELAQIFTLLQTQPIIEAKEKLKSLFQFIDSPYTLENIGKKFSASSFLSFLDFLTQYPSYRNQLNFILIGLHPSIFSQALHLFQERHLYLLQQEGLLEPLQYQLTQFVHEGESLGQIIDQSVQHFKHELTSIRFEELTSDRFQGLTKHIDNLRNHLLDYLERASAALAIVWHTDRVDLIEKLSSIHEAIQHQLTHFIGHPAFDHLHLPRSNRPLFQEDAGASSRNHAAGVPQPIEQAANWIEGGIAATGLYALLEHTLSGIFDSALKDDDAAIEGMTRLSIWHLQDYWEMGLLPSIQHLQELNLNPQKYSEQERWNHQHYLMSLVQQQLERLGIGTVGSLKQAHLYSKSLLKDYIEQHQHLLLKD